MWFIKPYAPLFSDSLCFGLLWCWLYSLIYSKITCSSEHHIQVQQRKEGEMGHIVYQLLRKEKNLFQKPPSGQLSLAQTHSHVYLKPITDERNRIIMTGLDQSKSTSKAGESVFLEPYGEEECEDLTKSRFCQ